MTSGAILACGPTWGVFIPFMIMGVLILGGAKTLLYYWFVQAFRYRVAAPVPMTPRQAWRIALIRAGLGVAVIGGTWLMLFLSPVSDRPAAEVIWLVAACERLAVWWALGSFLARLEGRRLLGWTLSGTGIDIATDAALYFAGDFGLASPVLGIAAILAFIAALYHAGRRASLLNRFTERPLCKACGYDLTGNLSGICPECGGRVGSPA